MAFLNLSLVVPESRLQFRLNLFYLYMNEFVFFRLKHCSKLLTHVLSNCVPRLFFCVLQIAELFITEKNCILYSIREDHTPTRTTQHNIHISRVTLLPLHLDCACCKAGLTVEPWSTVGVKRIVTGGKFPYSRSCQRFIVSSVN